eukprot:4591977-Amphidinium_carterae.1
MEEYNAVLAYFGRKGSTHFTRPNQRDLRAILSTTQTTEERERDLRRISQLPEMQPHKTQSIAEEDEIDANDNFDERSTTRASASSLKRKISEDTTDKNKKHPGANTVIYMYNPTISTQILGTASSSTSPRTPPTKEGTTT